MDFSEALSFRPVIEVMHVIEKTYLFKEQRGKTSYSANPREERALTIQMEKKIYRKMEIDPTCESLSSASRTMLFGNINQHTETVCIERTERQEKSAMGRL